MSNGYYIEETVFLEENFYTFIEQLVSSNDSIIFVDSGIERVIENYKKINRRFDTKLLRYYGINFIKQTYVNNKFLIISFLISLLLLINLTNTINEMRTNQSPTLMQVFASMN